MHMARWFVGKLLIAEDWTRLPNPSVLLSLRPYGDLSALDKESGVRR
jgi:hypothetical protein